MALFETIDVLELILPAFAGMVDTLEFDVAKLREEAPKGFTLATEVADWLVAQNVPFAQAHESPELWCGIVKSAVMIWRG